MPHLQTGEEAQLKCAQPSPRGQDGAPQDPRDPSKLGCSSHAPADPHGRHLRRDLHSGSTQSPAPALLGAPRRMRQTETWQEGKK